MMNILNMKDCSEKVQRLGRTFDGLNGEVFIDDNVEHIKYFEINDNKSRYLLFYSEKEESHIITIRKITENPKGKLCISKFLIDGIIEKIVEDKKR